MNHNVDTYDDIEVRRPQLARTYLELIRLQPGRPLAMFAPRRVGKTHFLDHDLAPEAQRVGWLPVYADLWLQKSAPLDAINHALEEALDDVTVPVTALSRLANTPVKKLGAFGASIDLDTTPARRVLPSAPELRLDALVTRLAQQAGKPVLLMLDEIQTLGDVPDGERIIATLRAVLHKRRKVLMSVFTGSSQEALARMLSSVGGPMYQFAQLLDFPALGDPYLKALAKHFAKVHAGKTLALSDLQTVFAQLGHKPGLLRDLVKAMSAEGVTDVRVGLQHFMSDERQIAGWQALLQPLQLSERAVLWALAQDLPPLGQGTLDLLAQLPGGRPTLAKVRAILERLRRAGLVSRPASGTVRLDDPLLAKYLQAKSLAQLR